MNLRPFLSLSFVAAALLGIAGHALAARLPTSTLVVNVLSVDLVSSNREATQYPGRPLVAFTTNRFVAKALIAKVLNSDHGLSAGSMIDIAYSVTVREPPDPRFKVRPSLNAGETRTLTVFGAGSSFDWRN